MIVVGLVKRANTQRRICMLMNLVLNHDDDSDSEVHIGKWETAPFRMLLHVCAR